MFQCYEHQYLIFYYFMGKIVKRKPFINKKSLYLKLAQLRKAKWAQKYHLQHQDPFKFHFCQGDEQESQQCPNKVSKNDHKTDQKVKNRLAAQQSREKKRNYVEQLEKKLDYYEELIQSQTCRQCQGSLRDKSDTELDMSEEKMELKDKQIQIDKYFQERMIRVDNQGAHTPFAIFFFICFIVVLTIFTYRSGEGIDQRILSNHDSLLYKTRQSQNEEILKVSLNLKKSLSYFEKNHKSLLDSNSQDDSLRQRKKDREAMSTNGNKWKKIGYLMCTKAQLSAPERPKVANSPFLMLRTADDKVKQEEKDTNDDENWTKGDVLTCIVS